MQDTNTLLLLAEFQVHTPPSLTLPISYFTICRPREMIEKVFWDWKDRQASIQSLLPSWRSFLWFLKVCPYQLSPTCHISLLDVPFFLMILFKPSIHPPSPLKRYLLTLGCLWWIDKLCFYLWKDKVSLRWKTFHFSPFSMHSSVLPFRLSP